MAANVSTPLPDLDLAPLSTITVTLDDPAAVITSLAVHGWQELPVPIPDSPPALLTVAAQPIPDDTETVAA